jgi:Replication-relaxation
MSAGSLQWGARSELERPLALTDRDLALIRIVSDVNYLSTSQLTLLGWGLDGERAAQRRLKRLHDSGHLDRFRPVSSVGSAEWNYRATGKGWAALLDAGIAPGSRSYTPAAITAVSYTEHDLQLASIVLSIALASVPSPRVGILEQLPFDWHGVRRGRIDADERTEREPVAVPLPTETRLRGVDSRAGFLEPDATLLGRAGSAAWAVLLEYDRTGRPHKQVDRFRRYDYWLLDGWRVGRFATHAAPPSVLFLTATESALGGLVEVADRALSAWYGSPDAGPREGNYPARQRMVFTSRPRVLSGDWNMLRVPRLPPAVRDDPTCQPRIIEYDLPKLFGASTGNHRGSVDGGSGVVGGA